MEHEAHGARPGRTVGLTHDEIVRRVVAWLRRRPQACQVVFAEMTTALSETPDAIGWAHGSSHVVEVKISRSDFFRDRHKPHMRTEETGMGQRRWYACPTGLLEPLDLPAWCGLLYVDARRCRVIRPAPVRAKWNARGETRMLTSALRRAQLGVRFDGARARWEAQATHLNRTLLATESELLAAGAVDRARL